MPRIPRTLTVSIIVLALAVLSGGCGSAMGDPREDLSRAINDFHGHLAWGRYQDAAGYLPESQRSQFIGASEAENASIHYTEFEVGTIDVNRVDESAIVTVTLRWYREPDYTIRQTRVRQVWVQDDENDYWYLTERSDADRLGSARN
ncbi:MAG: hypothetical protein KC561_00395 [Myxococcales bacterium]|nr:hypothetical protein [Myxococcales bacterium]